MQVVLETSNKRCILGHLWLTSLLGVTFGLRWIFSLLFICVCVPLMHMNADTLTGPPPGPDVDVSGLDTRRLGGRAHGFNEKSPPTDCPSYCSCLFLSLPFCGEWGECDREAVFSWAVVHVLGCRISLPCSELTSEVLLRTLAKPALINTL